MSVTAEPLVREPVDPVQRWRVVFRRAANPPDAVVRDAKRAWEQCLIDSGLPAAGLDSDKGRPKLALAAPLAAVVIGERELLDLWLTVRLPRWQVREALVGALPPSHDLVDLYDVWLRAPALPGQVTASVYRCRIPEDVAEGQVAAAAREMLAADRLPRDRAKGDSLITYDLRAMLEDVEVDRAVDGSYELVMVLRHHPQRGIGRPEEVLAELSDRLGTGAIGAAGETLVRERIILADE